jgi:hypothetical protein
MTEHLRPIPLLKEDRTMPVTDYMSIDHPTQNENFPASTSTSEATVTVYGRCGTSNSVSVTIKNAGTPTKSQTVQPGLSANTWTWTTGGFVLSSSSAYSVSATNGPTDSKSFSVR